MACTARANRELMQKSRNKLNEMAQNPGKYEPIECLRTACLLRGANGIKGLGRTFRIMDDDQNKALDLSEFRKGIHDYGLVSMEDDTIRTLFSQLDKDGSGTISFDEFLVALRGPMNTTRKALIHKAFAKLDKTGDGTITVDDLRGVYNCKKHPKYLNGELSEDQILGLFLDTFDVDNKDGIVTKEEFENYYAGVSASIDNDAYFSLVMLNSWNVS